MFQTIRSWYIDCPQTGGLIYKVFHILFSNFPFYFITLFHYLLLYSTNCSPFVSFCFKFGQILGLFHFLNSSGLLFFLPVGVEVWLENVLGTYKCSLSIFVLEVQPYLFVFNSATFGASLALFFDSPGLFFSFGAIFRVRNQIQKHLWNLLM